MFNPEFIFGLLGQMALLTIALLLAILVFKTEKAKQLQITVDRLSKSLEEMDEQAKLIVRTDMELNKTQEELDKKVAGLYALQKLSRTISTTLEENKIFKTIKPGNLEELEFEKACGFLWSAKENKFIARLNIGYLEDELEEIKASVASGQEAYLDLIEREKTISPISLQHGSRFNADNINLTFKTKSFVISPILLKEGGSGFLFVGTENADVVITAGDEELITILSNQVGQAIENARLFEKTWRAHQELEDKVEERTHELTLALEEVKKVSKRKTDFISSVSHELRTPLTSIKGYAAILIEEKLGQLPAAVKARLEKINYHSDELVHMVNDLLDIARIESGKATMNMAQQDIKAIISAIADLILIQCKNKNIELAVEIKGDMPLILADHSQIERIFINLLGNAVKFTPQDGKITISAHIQDGHVQIDISDTGIGIPQDALPMIFEEFYRVDNPINQKVKGTGLGLSLVKHIIEAHKGKIWANSIPGKGSTFSFTLPTM